MTPYELRFSIYQEARKILETEYHYKHDFFIQKIEKQESWEKLPPAPQYPTQENIEELARKIYSFVESKQA